MYEATQEFDLLAKPASIRNTNKEHVMRLRTAALSFVCCLICVSIGYSADWGMKEGVPDIKSAGAIAFGPDGILFVGDTKGATVFAIATGDTKAEKSAGKLKLEGLNKQVATTLGTDADS